MGLEGGEEGRGEGASEEQEEGVAVAHFVCKVKERRMYDDKKREGFKARELALPRSAVNVRRGVG